eukprot:803065-Pyramimonas_sp.AAC.1
MWGTALRAAQLPTHCRPGFGVRVCCGGCGAPASLGPLERSSRDQSGGAVCLVIPKRARGRRPSTSVQLARTDFRPT